MKVKSIWSKHQSRKGEVNEGISETIPDCSLSVRDILTRFRRGTLTVEEIRNQNYYDDDDLPVDPDIIDSVRDLSDIEVVRQNINLKQQKLYGEIKESVNRSGESSETNTHAPSVDQ